MPHGSSLAALASFRHAVAPQNSGSQSDHGDRAARGLVGRRFRNLVKILRPRLNLVDIPGIVLIDARL